MRYANNSNYKNDTMIRKEAYVGPAVLDELYRLVEETEIAKEDDRDWPVPDPSGQQELEIIMDDKHLKFTTCKLGALSEVNDCKDQEGLRVFYYLVQDLKCLVLSLISLHFRVSRLSLFHADQTCVGCMLCRTTVRSSCPHNSGRPTINCNFSISRHAGGWSLHRKWIHLFSGRPPGDFHSQHETLRASQTVRRCQQAPAVSLQ